MKVKRQLFSLLHWIGRILLVGLCFFAVLLAFLLLREALTRSKYVTEYPPPGQMVSLATHDIHMHCIGSGNPTVVFESDIDQLGSLSWSLVQSAVGEFSRACSYDRAGIMWSEPGPLPRDGDSIARELGAVLDAAGEDGPYILVGHAFGGAYIRIFAGQNPDDVCGMILVDSSHPDQLARFSVVGLEKEIPKKQIRPLILLLSNLGIPNRFTGPQYSMSRDVYNLQQAFLPKSSLAWFDESVEAPNTLAQAGQIESLDDIPIIVLASARPASVYTQVEGRSPQDFQDIWLELQQELTSLSENSEIRMFGESGHYIQFDQHHEVVEAIRDVIQRCGDSRSSP